MPDKAPVCPWCGSKMKPDRTFMSMLPVGCRPTFWWLCGHCGARSPVCDSGDKAYAAAMKRFEPTQKPCDDCDGIVYRQTSGGKIIPGGQCAVKFPPPCYRPDVDGCAYQIYGDNNDEPLDKCKECPLCYTDKVRREQKPLTLEEACGSEEPCVYMETRIDTGIHAADCVIAPSGRNAEIRIFAGNLVYPLSGYGKVWRCWLRKPTEEERKAAGWDDK